MPALYRRLKKQYCVTRKELLTVVHFSKYFKHYLYGKRFTVHTENRSLRLLMPWLEVLGVFDMKIEHRSGSQHRNADALSRIPSSVVLPAIGSAQRTSPM